MPRYRLSDCELYYEDEGQGQPVVFIHGLWVTGRFFRKQVPYFSQRYRAIVPDLRGHGRSEKVQHGYTVPIQARDLRDLLDGLGLRDVVLVGWSSGAFAIWDYIRQFGTQNVKGVVIVDESPSDLKWPDWPHGFTDFAGLRQLMEAIQTDRAGFVRNAFVPLLFREDPCAEDAAWMFEEITLMPEAIASAICFDELVRDYRPVLGQVDVPALVCFGRHDRCLAFANGEYLAQAMPDARLVAFERSGHMPFYEEPDRFNAEVDRFIQSLG